MHVSVGIVGFRNADDIVHCLTALAHSTYRDFDVVICENGGAAAEAELRGRIADRLPGGQPVEIIGAPDNPGFAGGVNRCIEARPDADAWWVVNPDSQPRPDALGALVARLERGDVSAVGGTLFLGNGRVQGHGGRWRAKLARAESIGNGEAGDTVSGGEIEAEMNYLLGACMLVSRAFVARVGLMREDYFLYCEEVEWFLRATRLGERIGFAPDARIDHMQGGATGSGLPIRERPRLPIFLDERNKINVVRDTAPHQLPMAAAAAFVLLALRYGRQRAWRQWRWGIAGWFAGLRNQRGKPAGF